jgi:hypothetical protein
MMNATKKARSAAFLTAIGALHTEVKDEKVVPLAQHRIPKPSLHVDDFVSYGVDQEDPNEKYARYVLMHFRLPAGMQMAFYQQYAEKKLFCNYKEKRMRCIGASRLGDVWLTWDHSKEHGYDLRVSPDECSNWGSKP